MISLIHVFLFAILFALIHISTIKAHLSNHTSARTENYRRLVGKSSNTYKKLYPCIIGNISTVEMSKWEIPEDAEAHYREILKVTSKFRNVAIHRWSQYSEKWVENHFIDRFMDKPLSFFNGLIPLFIQWVDIHVNDFLHRKPEIPPYSAIFTTLEGILRKDVLYIAVSQDDEGISRLQKNFPNVISFSAGGCGNIPIPLIKGELSPAGSTTSYKWDLAFFGDENTHSTRMELLKIVKETAGAERISIKFELTPDWQQKMSKTRFNLAPRGYGRTSFRMVEIIQLGRVPVYLYSDMPWIPYEGSEADFHHLGLVVNKGNITTMVKTVKAMAADPVRMETWLSAVSKARHMYTYDGVMKQIEMFFRDPLGPTGGYLRCALPPPKSPGDSRHLNVCQIY
eukprot:gene1111-2158_t